MNLNSSAESVHFGCICTAQAFVFLSGCGMKICPACRGGCQCTPGTSTTSVPFSKGGRDHRQKKCLSAHWHVGACGQLGDRALVQNQALQPCGRQGHQSVTWSRYLQIHWCDILRNKCPSESSLCFVSIQGEKNVSDDILTCSKESCSPERGDIPPETHIMNWRRTNQWFKKKKL